MQTETLAHVGSTFFNSLQHQEPAGVAPAISSARAAAEAAFEPIAAPVEPGDAEPQVIVIRRKKVIPLGGEPVDTDVGSPEPDEQARGGRVFRVDTPVVAPDTPQVEDTAPSAGSQAAAPEPIVSDSSKRKRRQKSVHGPVTVTRLMSEKPETTDVHPGSRASNALKKSAPPAAKRAHASRGSEDQPGETLRAQLAAAKRYQALVSDISRLQEKAEVLRKAEAANALKWIRQAVATYGITARDVDL